MAFAKTKMITLNESSLSGHILKPPSGSLVVQITPSIAKYALAKMNNSNRPLNAAKVIGYSKDMQGENWSLTGETIKFGSDGQLKDGQHRLEACVRSDTPFATHAIFGINPETFQHIDIGKKRDGADTLAMMGVPNYTKAASIIKMIIAFESGLTSPPSTGVSNDWLKEKYKSEIDHDLLQQSIALSKRLYNTTKWKHGVTGAFYYVATQKGQNDEVTKFFDDMSKGIGSKARSPVPFMLEAVNKIRHEKSVNLRAHHYSVMLSRAFHNYKSGKASRKADVTVSMDDKMIAF